MKLLLFEWLTGGGCWLDQVSPDLACPMFKQGWQMVHSLGLDLTAAGVEVVFPIDVRLPFSEFGFGKNVGVDSAAHLKSTLVEQADACDAIILIAPECDGCLAMCGQWMEPFREKWLSPDLEFIQLASDKQQTSELLNSRHVRVPNGCRLSDFDFDNLPVGWTFPAVVKPIDGAGSELIQVIDRWNDLETPSKLENYRIESFVSGVAVSVSVLCSALENEYLPPTGQVFDSLPIGNYIGTLFPLSSDLAERATTLARKSIAALPATRGYVGIDMVLCDGGPEGDCVVDINPRLTMSYVKLREVCGFNIARKMIGN